MREIQPELQMRLDSGVTRLCRCWQVIRQDGVVLGFTDHDGDLEFEGTVFKASTGMDASMIQTGTGLSVDNAQAVGALSDASVSEQDISAGRLDAAEIMHWLVDWERPDLRILMFKGTFGEIKRSDGLFEVELRGLAEALNVPVGRTIVRTCDRVLGDRKCGFDTGRTGFFALGVADAASSGATVRCGDMGSFEEGWFRQGVLTWTSGENAGTLGLIKMDRLSASGRRDLFLWQQPGRPISGGDAFRLVAGCDKTADTCRQKFGNFLNFRGFPHIPGEDWVTAYPKSGAVHDGSSLQDA
jgi:uncharacterized phage protein (TIGR02218 family)